MHPTLHPHRNLLAELADELEREGNTYRRRADALATVTPGPDEAGYLRGAQDAHANIVGRLRSILRAPLSTIVDVGDLFDDLERELNAGNVDKALTAAQAADAAARLIDGRNVGGGADGDRFSRFPLADG